MNQREKIKNLMEAERKAKTLFSAIEERSLIKSGKSDKELSNEIYILAKETLGISKYWHKRIVRSGTNTIYPYDYSPDDRIIEKDDILWIDFGPIFDDYEADIGRTYVLGNNTEKFRIKECVENAWYKTRDYFFGKEEISGKELFEYVNNLASKEGYKFGNNIAGHLIDVFPHNKIHGKEISNYISMDNNTNLKSKFEDKERFWILEVHFLDEKKRFGSFFEQLLI